MEKLLMASANVLTELPGLEVRC